MLKQIIAAAAISIASVSAMAADTINLLLLSAPGGIYDTQTRALEKTLKSAGYDTNYVLTNSCKGAVAWMKSNPGKPVIFNVSAEEQINFRNNPTSDGACDIGFNRDTILSLALITNMNVCTMHPAEGALDRFLKGKNNIGATFIPPSNALLVNGLIDTLKLDAKHVPYQGQVKLMQALLSKDIDFAVFGNVKGALASGATCILTTADIKSAKRLQRTSLESISPGNPWIDAKQVYAFLGHNVDKTKMREIIITTLKTDETIKQNLAVGYEIKGLAAGDTEEQQWKYVETHMSKNIKGK
jgi:hypothetical protein